MQQDADGLRTALHRLGSGILPLEAVTAGRNQQDLPVLIIAAGLRKIPHRALRLAVASTGLRMTTACPRPPS
jgi:hypothetical protein